MGGNFSISDIRKVYVLMYIVRIPLSSVMMTTSKYNYDCVSLILSIMYPPFLLSCVWHAKMIFIQLHKICFDSLRIELVSFQRTIHV